MSQVVFFSGNLLKSFESPNLIEKHMENQLNEECDRKIRYFNWLML